MSHAFARQDSDGTSTFGNERFTFSVGLNPEQAPVVRALTLTAGPGINRAATGEVLSPELVVRGVRSSAKTGGLQWRGMEVDRSTAELRIGYVAARPSAISPGPGCWRRGSPAGSRTRAAPRSWC